MLQIGVKGESEWLPSCSYKVIYKAYGLEMFPENYLFGDLKKIAISFSDWNCFVDW